MILSASCALMEEPLTDCTKVFRWSMSQISILVWWPKYNA